MDQLVRARVLLAEAESLGLTIEDLTEVASGRPRAKDEVPTVAEFVALVDASMLDSSAETYRGYWRLHVERFGGRGVDAVLHRDCETTVTDAVEKARRRPGCDGRSSQEHCVSALRALYGRAERAGLIQRNPAAGLDPGRRPESRRRALDDHELADLVDAIRTTTHDPELELLLVRFHLESGARREGALNLRLGDLDSRRSTAWLDEKYGKVREQPVSPSLLAALESFARSRGAVADQDAIFRNKRGQRIGPGRYNRMFERVREVLPWTRRVSATAHPLRHTAGKAVERTAGYAVAQAFLGHAPATVTGVYTKASIDEVASAVATLTGEPHPLAGS